MKNSFRDGSLQPAITSFFNQDIDASRRFLATHLRACPEDCLAHGLKAAIEFYDVVLRWMLTCRGESVAGFIRNHRMVLADDRRATILDSLSCAENLARRAEPESEIADMGLFTLSLVSSVRRDYEGLVRNQWMACLTHAQEANLLGRKLLKANPGAHDAYLVFAWSEYLISRTPPAVRPFAKIPGIAGNRSKAIQFCLVSSKSGCYFRELAMCLLTVLYTEEGNEDHAIEILNQLAERFPNNAMFLAELRRRQKSSQA